MKKIFFKHKFFVFLIVFLHFIILKNTSFTVWPEMILYPWLQTKGFLLYKDIINPYFPLLPYFLFAVFKIFGSSVLVLKIFTWIIILISDLLIYFFALRISKNNFLSLLAIIFFIALQVSLGGNGLWFELAMVPFVVTSTALVYLENKNKQSLFLAGFLLSLAILIKQNAALFLIPITLFLLLRLKIKTQIVYLLIPFLITFGAIFIFLFNQNLLADFYIWALHSPLNYPSQTGFIQLPTKKQYLLIFLPLLPLIGVVLNKHYQTLDKVYWLVILLIAMLFAFPRYENFHLQLLVALSSLLAINLPKKLLFVYLTVCLLLLSMTLTKQWHIEDRFIDQETLLLAKKIAKYDSVYLINNPELAYFFANKVPPKPWAITFPWYFEQPGFAEKFVLGLSKNTNFVVMTKIPNADKYALGNYIPSQVLNYIESNFKIYESNQKYQIWQKK